MCRGTAGCEHVSRVTCHAEEQGLSQHAAHSVKGGHGVVYIIIYLHYAVANTEHRAGADTPDRGLSCWSLCECLVSSSLDIRGKAAIIPSLCVHAPD